MKLDYATLISPHPLNLPKIGHIKSPTLREIWNPAITYKVYSVFLSLLLTDIRFYCGKINPNKSEWFSSLSDNEKQQLNIFDIISQDRGLQEQYQDLLDFFFVEDVIWDGDNHLFITYINRDENGNIIPIGLIHKGVWSELCDVILQRCGVNRDNIENIDKSKVKSKRALETLKKLEKGRQNAQKNIERDKDTELPNIISKVAIMAKSINYTNIWDLTVFQLHEQFRQECANVYFNIQTMSVAAYGNEKKTFKGNEWYTNFHPATN